MKTFTKTLKNTLIICFLLATTFIMAQTTHIVNNDAGAAADFADLQAAIDAATNGDIIYVQQSPTNYGNITINKALTIVGRSHSDGGYKSQIGTIWFDTGSSNTTLKGLKINSIVDTGSSTTLTDLHFYDNEITNFNGLGSTNIINNILIQGNNIKSTLTVGTNTSNVLITNNIFFSSTIIFSQTATTLFANNVMAYYPGTTFNNNTPGLLNISNCIFIGNSSTSQTVKFNPGSGSIQVDNCASYNYNTSNTYTFNTGTGITINANNQENTDPLFTNVDPSSTESIAKSFNTNKFDPANDDLTLQAGTPVSDAGLFQGYNFKNFGTPTGFPSLKIDSHSTTVPKNSNLTVTITAKTN